MKLKEIWESPAGWQSLSATKKAPKLAYRLLKYEKKVERELEVIRKQRETIIYEVIGNERPKHGDILLISIPETIDNPEQIPGPEPREQIVNPQHRAFHDKFNEFLDGVSDLGWIGLSMEELVEGLGEANVMSENDLERLEPFFTEPPPPESTVH